MTKYKTVGYQLLIEKEEKQVDVKNSEGLILASGKDSHQLRSGIVKEIGSLALKEDPEIEIGDRVYFIDREAIDYRVNSDVLTIIETRFIKIVEKSK